jgi:hypothetical protein
MAAHKRATLFPSNGPFNIAIFSVIEDKYWHVVFHALGDCGRVHHS